MFLHRNKVKDSHNKLTDRMIVLGYPKICDDGVCIGVAKMGIFAILCGDTDTFDKRFYALSNIPKNKFIHFIDKIKIKKKRKTTDLLVVEIPAFFDGITLFQFSSSYKNWINDNNIRSLLVPKKLDKKSDFVRISGIHGAYTQSDLVSYLSELGNALSDLKESTAFLLSSSNHSIALGFDPKYQEWLLIDANSLPTLHFKNKNELAKQILISFSKNAVAVFKTTVYSFNNRAKLAIEKCQQQNAWKKIHEVTEEKAQLKDSDNISWLYIPAENNDLSAVKKLIEKNSLCINDASKYNGWTPLYIASLFNHINIVKELLTAGANPNLTTFEGKTPLFEAISWGYLELAEELLKAGADPNLACKDGRTPLSIATEKNYTEIIEKIAQLVNKGKKRKLSDSQSDLQHLSVFTHTSTENEAQTNHLNKKRNCSI